MTAKKDNDDEEATSIAEGMSWRDKMTGRSSVYWNDIFDIVIS